MAGSGGSFGIGIDDYPDLFGAAVAQELAFADLFPPGVAQLTARDVRAMEASRMSFLDTIVGAAKTVGTTIIEGAQALPALVPAIVAAGQAVQTVRNVLNGEVGAPMAAPAGMPPAMAAAAMAMGGGATTQGSDAQADFARACGLDPSCTAAVWAALGGGAMNGGTMTQGMMNGSTDAGAIEAQLAGLGVPPALIMALRSGGASALTALRSFLPGAAVGVGSALALEAATGLLPSAAGTKFPRRIFIPDPKGGSREYTYRGRPLLYSSDVAALRRVQKIAKRAKVGRRRPAPRSAQILALPSHNWCTGCNTSPCACNGR